MGLEYFWKAVEPDLRVQKRLSWFLESWATRKGVSYAAYDGPMTGYFLDLDTIRGAPAPEILAPTTRSFLGVSLGGRPEDFLPLKNESGLCQHQQSFVFDNTEGAGNVLVTLERIPSFDFKRYDFCRRFFAKTPLRPDLELCAAFRRGSSLRGGGDDFLHSLQVEWLPSLEWNDPIEEFGGDWQDSAEVHEREFTPRALDPVSASDGRESGDRALR